VCAEEFGTVAGDDHAVLVLGTAESFDGGAAGYGMSLTS
jgi:hypothetical protein